MKKEDIVSETQDLLGLVGLEVTKVEIRSWSDKKREKVCDWAALSHLSASDNPVKVPPKPQFKSKALLFRGIWPCKTGMSNKRRTS